MLHVLRILADSLSGVEYSVCDGVTVFHVGPQEDLANGRAAQLLAADDRAYFIPADLPVAAFALQAAATEGRLQLGERADAQAAWTWRALPLQQPIQAAGVHFAVREQHAEWSAQVLAFVPPALPVELAVAAAPDDVTRPGRRRPALLLGIAALLAAGAGAAWFYWQHQPEARVRGLAAVLSNAPADYAIVPGNDGRLYAFSDSASARSWGERASRRAQRRNDNHLLRREEALRLEQALIAAGMELVVVRLDDPARPEVVLSGHLTAARTTQVGAVLAPHAPYLKQARVSAISDQQLISLARQQMRVLGISTRTEPRGQRVSIVNDVFLDDAGLNAMAGAARNFHQRWGMRRISLAPQLWDDLLQGRSYRYSPGQLLSVGSGRWDYSRAAASQAAP
jgi:hypothetical protein